VAMFGKTMKTARISKGLTLRELGAKVDYPISALSEIENGTRRMPDNEQLLLKTTQLLGIDLSQAKDEIEVDSFKCYPYRLIRIFRSNEKLAESFFKAIENISDDELVIIFMDILKKIKED
jgi:transcriptional regulator with XRE-family HTH domain